MENWGYLLLCSHLGDPQRRVLTTAQARTLSQRVRDHGPWAEDREVSLGDLIALGYPEAFARRVVSLLGETEVLTHYLQKGKNRKCVPLTRLDRRYPGQVRKKLGQDSPGCLWAKGDFSLLEGPMLSLVGCRQLETENKAFAEHVGLEAARQGYVLVSGNAVGADQAAQRACWKAGGRVICVVADALHSHLEAPNVLYLSEEDFDMPFSPFRALRRNRVIHTMGACTLVSQVRLGHGGSWDGTSQNLKHGWTPVYGFRDGSDGMRALESMGAELIGMEALADYGKLGEGSTNFLEDIDVL